MPRTFVHREFEPKDPAFLRDKRQFLQRQLGTLHVMERERDHLVRDIEQCRSLAKRAGIPVYRALEREVRRLLALIGIGNRFRRDDAAGLEVARRLRLAYPPGVTFFEQEGEPTSLIETWSDLDEALVVDGVNSGSDPGTIHRFEATAEPLPAELFRPSTHAMDLAEAVELGRELNRLPGRLVVYGIEGESFEAGEGLTPAVQDAVARLVTNLYHELSGASCGKELQMSEDRRTTTEEARRVGDEIGVDWNRFELEQFRAGMDVEYEHGSHDPQTDVTGDDPITTGKIALAHMKEFPDYYERLERMEAEAKRNWADRG